MKISAEAAAILIRTNWRLWGIALTGALIAISSTAWAGDFSVLAEFR